MAVNSVPVGSVLRLQFQTGTDLNGDPVYRTKSLNNIKPQAVEQDLFDIAQALTQLQQHALVTVQRVDSSMLESV